MSLITSEQFRPSWTQAQVDLFVNQMPITALQFAVTSSLFHRFFGVLNGSNDGERIAVQDPADSSRSDTPDRFILNACARYAFPRVADSVVSALEQEIGYALTPRYVTETVPYQTSHGKFQTLYPGVEKFNVRRVWYALEDYAEIPLDPFVEELSIVGGGIVYPYSDGGVTPAVRVDDKLVTNPNEIIIRNASGAIFPWFSDTGHPMVRENGYWQLALAVNRKAYNSEDLLIQHKKLMYVDVPVPTLPAGAKFFPVYPDSTQIIHQAKPMQVVTDGDDTYWRFWFYNYTLVHPDFVAETVDLQVGEFYKLYPYISFMYNVEETVKPEIVITYGDEEIILTPDDDTVYPKLTLTDSSYGVFHVNYESCRDYIDEWCRCNDGPTSIMMRFSYKTNPGLLPVRYQQQIGRLMEAAAGRIAAELPTTDCGCEVPYGFIADKKKALPTATFSDLTGNIIDRFRYGSAFGHIEYANALATAMRYSRPVQLRIKS
jgi:hypothetical protein